MTRLEFGHSAEDVAIMLDTISGDCEFDSTCVGIADTHFTKDLEKSISDKDIGIDKSLMKDLSPKLLEQIQNAISSLKEIGVVVKDVVLPDLKEALSTY